MRRDRFAFWGALVGLWLLGAAWALSNPLMASPDEPAHTLRAAAVVRGQLFQPDAEGGSLARLPYYYPLITGYPVCYMFQPNETGVCEPEAVAPLDEVTDAVTPAGRYNPLYYTLVGLPTLLPPGDGLLYAMRLISAALSALLVAAGLRAIAQTPAPGWALAGAAVALTPMVMFLSSTVNPAGLEITAAFALWAQLLTLLRHPDPAQVGRRMAWVAASAVLLMNARGLSLLWAATIVVVVLVVSPWSSVRQVLRTRSAWPSFAVIAVGGLAAASWILATNSLGSGGAVLDEGLTFLVAAKATVLAWNTYLLNMIGQFGWTDTPLPVSVHLAWGAALGAVLVPAVAVARRREQLGLLLVAGATVALPVLVHASQARYLGLIWQGRYVLPVAIGLPILAGYVLAERAAAAPLGADGARWLRRLSATFGATVVAVLVLVQGAALAINTHRYVNGDDGPWFSLAPDAWLPPVTLAVLVPGAALAVLAWGAALVVGTRPADDGGREHPTTVTAGVDATSGPDPGP